MLPALYTAATALDAFQTSLDASANNLANVNTTSFKRSIVDFQDLLYSGPDQLQVGHGVKVSDVSLRDFDQGPALNTGKDLDLLVDGRGFFAVQAPDGQIQYTRDGAFHRDAFGRMVTSDGYLLQPPITFPADTLSTTIDSNGVVTVLTSSSPAVPQVLGQITLARFLNPDGLRIESGNRYSETEASGLPTTAIPGTNALGILRQRNLEQSNVDVTSELTSLISAQRAYGINSRVVRTSDQLISSALDTIR
ncbi:MAG: flagellar basal-body rod protein FlgG [Planctomycetota bacterium]